METRYKTRPAGRCNPAPCRGEIKLKEMRYDRQHMTAREYCRKYSPNQLQNASYTPGEWLCEHGGDLLAGVAMLVFIALISIVGALFE